MLGHLFERGNPRQDYVLAEMANYLGTTIRPAAAKDADRILLAPLGGTVRPKGKGNALVRCRPVTKGKDILGTKVRGYFSWKGLRVPYFGTLGPDGQGDVFLKDEKGKALIRLDPGDGLPGSLIGFDILNTVYYFLSGIEEIDSTVRDEHGRFPHTASTLYKRGLMLTPVVTAYMDVFGELVRAICRRTGRPFYRIWPWPYGARFALGLSHDTDEIKRFTLKKSAHSALKKDIPGSLDALTGSLSNLEGNDYWTYERINEVERKHGANSTFFFSGLTKKERSSRPRKEMKGCELAYTTDHPDIKKLYRKLAEKGWEVALHSSYTANGDPGKLKREMKTISGMIDRDVLGVRQHFLKFAMDEHVKALKKAGFKYDSSIGYSTHTGFRAGACYPYRLFDHGSGADSGVLEIPLAIMEVCLSGAKSVTPKAVLERAAGPLEVLEKFNGGCALLWHNNRYCDSEYRGWGEAYRRILGHSVKRRGHLAALGDIWKWMEGRGRVALKRSKGALSVSSDVSMKGVAIEIDPGEEGLGEIERRTPDAKVEELAGGSVLVTLERVGRTGSVKIPLA